MDTSVAIKLDSRGVETGARKVRSELGSLSTSAKRVQKSMSKSFKQISSSIFSIKGGIVSLVAGLSFGAVISEGRKFGAALGELSAITGATGADLEFLSEKAREFGRTTTLTAVEAATAFKLIASAKPDLLESGAALAKVTEQAIILAEAAGQDLPTAARSLGSALNQFKSGAEDASKFVNVLAAGAKFGAASVLETAESLKFAGTVAKDANVSFEETVAAIQAMSLVAIKGGEAGTGLRNIIIRLAQTGKRELTPSVVGLTKALENLNKENLTTVELTEIVGLRSVVALKAILGNVAGLKLLTGQVTDTNIALEQQAAQIDNLDGDLKKLNSAYSDLKIGLEQAADAGLRKFTQAMTEFTTSLIENIDTIIKTGKAIAILIASIAAAKLLGPIINATVLGVWALVKAIAAFRTGLLGAQVAMLATIGTLGALRIAFAALGGVAGVIIAVVGAIAAYSVATDDAKLSTAEYATELDNLSDSMKNFSLVRVEAEIVRRNRQVSALTADLKELKEELSGERTDGRRAPRMRGGANAAERRTGTPATGDAAVLLREQIENTETSLRNLQFVIAELEHTQLELGDTSKLEDESAKFKKFADEADEIGQRFRTATKGIFPEEEQIRKIRTARAEIQQLIAVIEDPKIEPLVSKQLEQDGVTVEKLRVAFGKLGGEITALEEKAGRGTGVTKVYHDEIDKLERSIAMATIAAQNNGVVTNLQRVEYELLNGTLKDLTDTEGKRAAALKAAAAELDRQKLILQTNRALEASKRANDLASIAIAQGTALTHAQTLEYDLQFGSLKKLNNQMEIAKLRAEALRADTIADFVKAEAIKDALDPLRAYNRELQQLDRLLKIGALTQDQYAEAVRNAALANNEAATIIRDEFGDAFTGLIDGTKSVSEAFHDMVGNIVKSVNDIVARKLGEALFDSIFTPGANVSGAGGILDLFSGGAAGGKDAAPPEFNTKKEITVNNPLPVQIIGEALAEDICACTGGGGGFGEAGTGRGGPDATDELEAQEAKKTVMQKLFDGIKSGFTRVFDFFKGGFTKVLDFFKGGFSGMIDTVSGLFEGGFSGIFDKIGGLFEGGFGGIFDSISSLFSGGFGGILDSVSGLFGGGGGLGGIVGSIGSLFGFAHGGKFAMPETPTDSIRRFASGGSLTVPRARAQDTIPTADTLKKFAIGGSFQIGNAIPIPAANDSFKVGDGFAEGGGFSMHRNTSQVTFRASPNERVTVRDAFGNGGGFRVGGSGGIDSQVVSLQAPEGSSVTITRPEQESRMMSFAHGGVIPASGGGGETINASADQNGGRQVVVHVTAKGDVTPKTAGQVGRDMGVQIQNAMRRG